MPHFDIFDRSAFEHLCIGQVHILTPNEPIGDVYDWEAGVHGLAVEFRAGRGRIEVTAQGGNGGWGLGVREGEGWG